MTTPTSKSYLEAWQSDMEERQKLEDRIAELEEIIERMCHADAIVITANEERLEAENAEVKCEWIKAPRKNNDLITRILAVATERIGLDARDVLEEELRHAGLLGGGDEQR